MMNGSGSRIQDFSPLRLRSHIIKVIFLWRCHHPVPYPPLINFFAEIFNQLLDFYDEIERQNAVSAQSAVGETLEQHLLCSSSRGAEAAPTTSKPDLKVDSVSVPPICATRLLLFCLSLVVNFHILSLQNSAGFCWYRNFGFGNSKWLLSHDTDRYLIPILQMNWRVI